MSEPADDLLQTMIVTLRGLQEKSAAIGRANLEFLIELARKEAEDELNTSRAQADLRATLERSSIVGAWH